MKKTIILLSAAVLVFAACQKEDGSVTGTNGLELTATVEQQDAGSETKTYLDELQVKWSAGDQVNVFTDASETLTLTLTSGAGTTSGSFSTSVTPTGDAKYAIYPASDGNSISTTGSTITFSLPSTQNYVANSFDNGANVAVGKVSNGAIAYKNVCGVLKLQLLGNVTVDHIELSGKNGEHLCGTFTVDADSLTSAGATYSEGGGTTLTLDCGDGVTLSYKTATDFCFVVPVGAFGNETNPGFTVNVFTSSSLYQTLQTSSNNEIKRSRIKAMPYSELQYALPSGYTEVKYIESQNKTSYINTNYIANSGISWEMKCNFTGFSGYSWIAGNRKSADSRFGVVLFSNGMWDLGCGDDYTSGNCAAINTDYIVTFSSTISDDLTPTTLTTSSGVNVSTTSKVNNNLPLYIFSNNYDGVTSDGALCKMYYFKLWDEGTLVRHFIPCYYSTGSQVGMYDIVTNTFYPGTGSFVAGPEVDD